MAHIKVLVFRILFLVLIAHSLADRALVASAGKQDARPPTEPEEAPSSAAQLGAGRNRWPQDAHEQAATTTSAFEEAQDVKVELIEGQERVKDQLSASSYKRRSSSRSASEPNYADLCYLSNGGSSITLTVNEATQVGSVIGTLDVNGDPAADGGNVELYDASDSAPTGSLAPGDGSTVAAGGAKRRVLGRRSSSPSLLGLVSEPGQQASASGNFYSVLAGPGASGQASSASPPVRIEPGTRNLVLARPLDKESGESDQSLLVNIRCRARPSPKTRAGREWSTIPVRIIVTDANDHAPEFLGPQPYQVNVSETTPIGTIVSRDILAQDRDSAGPFSTLHYRVLDELAPLQFANPLEPTLVLASPLDYETQGASFTLTIQVQDEGEPEPLSASAQVRVNIIDFDDQNPRFLDDKYTLIMDEAQQNSVGQSVQVLPRNLYAEDGDRGIQAPIVYTFEQAGRLEHEALEPASSAPINSSSADQADQVDNYLHLNAASGELRLIRQWPTSGPLSSSPLTLVVRATQADNKDRYTLTTITVTRPQVSAGSGAPPATGGGLGSQQRARNNPAVGLEFSSARLELSVLESAPINETIGRARARYLGDPRSRPTSNSDGQADSSADSSGSGAVELIGERQVARSRAARWATALESTQAGARRSINYQILDDQTGQFGINALGEIFVKRALDFETRQEYRLRVLATYLKYSDTCQVHIHVLNVNDNKPKFSQPQYTFQLTETRLRSSNVIGQVQAHDADLNDTLRYSLVGGEFAHLFEIGPLSGQISLKPSIRQLDVTSCQLLVLVADSLAMPPNQPAHTSQARVNLQVAPQLIGRSLNLNQTPKVVATLRPPEMNQTTREMAGAEEQPAGSQGARSLAKDRQQVLLNQRSSVATVMSSLQHMVRSVNFLDMPMSSVVLLSGLLALLVCLLLVIVLSMGVQIYKRRVKHRHRHHLSATAHLRRPNMALVHPSSSNSNGSSPSSSLPSSSAPLPAQGLTGASRYLAARSSKTSPLAAPTRHETNLLGSPKQEASKQAAGELSMISSLSSNQSKRSYRSNTTDDSSVMHCGHYSVTASRRPSPSQRAHLSGPIKSLLGPTGAELAAAAIKSLVREADEEEAAEQEADRARQSRNNSSCSPQSNSLAELRVSANELTVLTNSKPGIKSYRKLPLGSLVRTQAPREPECTASKGDQVTSDSAIASDSSTEAASRQPGAAASPQRSGALMALIREPQGAGQASEIKWPTGATPQRVKRLTWDDELSLAEDRDGNNNSADAHQDDCCFVSPDFRLMSPLSNHEYPIEGTTNLEDHYAEQHFLFSHPGSPAANLAAPLAGEPAGSQNNCLDYTIVQSSQFQVESLRTDEMQPQLADRGRALQSLSSAASLSAQHHLLLQRGNERAPSELIPYLYSTPASIGKVKHQQSNVNSFSPPTNSDLKLMTTAVL